MLKQVGKLVVAGALTLALWGFSTPAHANHDSINPNQEQIKCLVVGVYDGDTLTCLTQDKQQIKVRLSSIDAPEKAQAFGNKAKQALSDLVYKKMVTLSIESTDKYGRKIAEVFTNDDNVSANFEMVFKGMAWCYERYAKDPAYCQAQNLARRNAIGLWVDKNPIMPEQYRHSK